MRSISRDIACAVIESADGLFLLGRKDPSKGGVYTDCWHIPGGGAKKGETLEQAVCREVFEEVGISLEDVSISLVDDRDGATAEKTLDSGERVVCHMKFFVFHARLFQQAEEIELSLETDLVQACWFTPEQLSELQLVPAGRPLFRRLKIIRT